MSTTEPKQPQPPRARARRRTEQDPVLDNLIWLQETRAERLAEVRRDR